MNIIFTENLSNLNVYSNQNEVFFYIFYAIRGRAAKVEMKAS